MKEKLKLAFIFSAMAVKFSFSSPGINTWANTVCGTAQWSLCAPSSSLSSQRANKFWVSLAPPWGKKKLQTQTFLEAIPSEGSSPPPLAGSSREGWSPSRTRSSLERSPPRCRRRGSGCGARRPRCSTSRWILTQPSSGLFGFSSPIISLLSSASAFPAHALTSPDVISPSSPPCHHKEFSCRHYFYSHSAYFLFFFFSPLLCGFLI